jgi:hypothetical protein
MNDRIVLTIPGRSQRISLLETIQMTHSHVFGVHVADLHATDETATGAHAQSHGSWNLYEFYYTGLSNMKFLTV